MAIKYFDGKKWIDVAGGERGPAGPQGPQGEQGPQGPAGPSGGPPVLVWTNSDSSQNFTAKTVSMSLSSYTFVLIVSRLSTSSSGRACTIIPVGNIGVSFLKSASSNTLYSRQATVNTSGIEFGNGYSGTTSGAQYCVPEKVYGII